MAEIGDVIEKSIFLSPNQSLLAEYLSEANPKYVHTWSSADHTGTQSATEYYEQHGLGIIFRHREEANYVFATKPYAFLDDVCLLPKFGVFQNNFLIYKHLTNKLSQWSILAVEGSELLSKQIHAQMVYSNYEIGWRDEFRPTGSVIRCLQVGTEIAAVLSLSFRRTARILILLRSCGQPIF